MAAPYRLIVFDFDGTLVDTVADIAHHANRTLDQHGFGPKPLDEIRRSIGWGVHELLSLLAPPLGQDPHKLEEAVEHFKRSYRDQPVLHTTPFPHVVRMLGGTLAGSDLAIVTNKPEDITLRILDLLGMRGHFKRVIGIHAGFAPKPDPAGLLDVMRTQRAHARETVYIGDSRVDAQTAAAAGVHFGWVSYGYDDRPEGEPQFRFNSALEWEALVR